MATRSYIGIQNEDGSVRSIYCHWDGYPSHNGKILQEHYSDKEKLNELIDLGDISSLGSRIRPNSDEPHSYDSPSEDVVVAYHRDRGEEYIRPREDDSIETFVEKGYEEYGYVFTKDGNWLVFN